MDVVHCDGNEGPCPGHDLHDDEELIWPEPEPEPVMNTTQAQEPEVRAGALSTEVRRP